MKCEYDGTSLLISRADDVQTTDLLSISVTTSGVLIKRLHSDPMLLGLVGGALKLVDASDEVYTLYFRQPVTLERLPTSDSKDILKVLSDVIGVRRSIDTPTQMGPWRLVATPGTTEVSADEITSPIRGRIELALHSVQSAISIEFDSDSRETILRYVADMIDYREKWVDLSSHFESIDQKAVYDDLLDRKVSVTDARMMTNLLKSDFDTAVACANDYLQQSEELSLSPLWGALKKAKLLTGAGPAPSNWKSWNRAIAYQREMLSAIPFLPRDYSVVYAGTEIFPSIEATSVPLTYATTQSIPRARLNGSESTTE